MTKRKVVDKDLTPYTVTSREIRALADETRSRRDEYQGEFDSRRGFATLLGLPAGPLVAMSMITQMAPALVNRQYRDWIRWAENGYGPHFPINTMAFIIGYLCLYNLPPPWQERNLESLLMGFILARKGLLPNDVYPIERALYFIDVFKMYLIDNGYGGLLSRGRSTVEDIRYLINMGGQALSEWRIQGRFDEQGIAGGFIPAQYSEFPRVEYRSDGGTPFRETDNTIISPTAFTTTAGITVTTNSFTLTKKATQEPVSQLPEETPAETPPSPPVTSGKRELTVLPLEDTQLQYRKSRSLKK